MPVEVKDEIVRADLLNHEASTAPHEGAFVLATGDTVMPYVLLQSPDEKVWKLTIDNDGILTATDVTDEI